MLLIGNQIIINLALIVSTVLTCYFVALKFSGNSRIFNQIDLTNTPFWVIFLFGFFIGLSSLILSNNEIVIFNSFKVDMRYVFIFFSVMYGSIQLGEITTCVVVFGKTLQYLLSGTGGLSFYLNNILLTFLLLAVCILAKKQHYSWKKSLIVFLSFFIILRIFIFSFVYAPLLQPQKLLNLFFYFLIFSSIFLITYVIINMVVSVTNTMNHYKARASTDHLTGLYNRRIFSADLSDTYILSKKSKQAFALGILDIDNFKMINDTYGHQTGDSVLKYLANQMHEFTERKDIYIYRIGGEEFAILTSLSKKETTQILAEFRQQLISHPFVENGHPLPITVSIGMTEFNHLSDIDSYENSDILYVRADKALYEAKRTGKDKLIWF